MNKKGFTLIELLAVIVILSIIALIITPIVSDIIKNTKKQAVKQSTLHLIEAGENYVAQKMLDENGNSVTYPIAFTCDGTNCTSGTDTLLVSGDIPKSGKVVIESERNIYVTNIAFAGDKCLFGTKTSLAEGDCVTVTPATPVNVSNDYGLFDYENNLLVSWNDLVNVYGLDISKDYTEQTYTEASSGASVFTAIDEAGDLKIPPYIERIGNYAFYNCEGLLSVHIPTEVRHIGIGAFKNSDIDYAFFEFTDDWYQTDTAAGNGGDDIELSTPSYAANGLVNGEYSNHYLKRR